MNPSRASRLAAALLLTPPANPWRPVLLPVSTRQRVAPQCNASKFNRSSSNNAGSRFSQTDGSSSKGLRGSAKHQQTDGLAGMQNGVKEKHSGDRSRAQPSRPGNSSKPQQDTRTAARQESNSSSKSSFLSTSRKAAAINSRQSDTAVAVGSPLPKHAALLVVGGGAAGLTAAFFAAQLGAQVVVLERTREAGKKVLMSGGTRCNVLPLEVDLPIDYITSSSRSALRAVFASWSLEECHAWLSRDIGLQLVLEQETRKWFPASNSGREVRDRLVAACQALGVKFVYNASVEQITPPAAPQDHQQPEQQQQNQNLPAAASNTGRPGSSTQWRVGLASGESVLADKVVISTGGYSFPAVGTDGTGLRLLCALGHKLSVGQCYAALTPLKGPHPGGEQLAGLTLAGVQLSVLKPGSNKVLAAAQRGGLLFTHKGYSGPAVLDVSHWLVKELEEQQRTKGHSQQQQQQQPQVPRLVVDWTGEGLQVWQERFAAAPGATTVNQLLRKHGIKERLANALASEVGVNSKPLSQLKKNEKEQLLTALTAWQLPIQGHEGYPKAEVTGGGVPLEQVDCKTMESRVLPGLYLCGEVLDVFGRIGGFNFWWAWLSGRMAGQAAGAAVSASAAKAVGSKQPGAKQADSKR